jgi:hypothetical protein
LKLKILEAEEVIFQENFIYLFLFYLFIFFLGDGGLRFAQAGSESQSSLSLPAN